jgi:hypothetical protein
MKRLIIASLLLVAVRGAWADDHLVIVLDTSSSMSTMMRGGKTRMKTAQDALIEVLSKVPDKTKIGILSFKGWVYDLQQVDQARLTQAIRSTQPEGGTPLYQYMSIAGTRLVQERAKQGNVGAYKLLVVTDGQASDSSLNQDGRFPDGTYRPGVVKDIVLRGIIVDAIGLDMRQDHPLKTQINGQYMRGDDPGSLKQAVSKAVAEVVVGDSKDVTEEEFAEISELPDNFVMAAVEGLTTFQNHPVGEKGSIPYEKPGNYTGVSFEADQPADSGGPAGVSFEADQPADSGGPAVDGGNQKEEGSSGTAFLAVLVVLVGIGILVFFIRRAQSPQR